MNPNPSKQDRQVLGEDPGEFKVIPWVRTVRDAMYEETRQLSADDFAEYIRRRVATVRKSAKS